MRKAWLTSITAALCAMSTLSPSLDAAPVDMAIASHRAGKTRAMSSAPTRDQASWAAGAARPTSGISPVKQPWQYLKAAVSEMPINAKQRATANVVANPARPHNDSIALSTPIGPPTPQLLISTAQLCERQNDVERARRHFQQALNLWPGHVEVLRAAARMEDRQGNLPLAENLYQQAVASNPQHAGALNDLGLCLARQGKLEPSIQVIEQAINIQPDKPLFRNNAATVLVEMRQDQRALAHLAAVHGAGEANFNLGQLLVQRGRPTDAIAYYQAALEHNPELNEAQAALAQMPGGRIADAAAGSMRPAGVPSQQPATSPVPNSAEPSSPQYGPQLMKYPATGTAPHMTAGPQTPTYLPPVAQRPGQMQR